MNESVAFKARAHLLKLLGDELIGDDRLAIFELVKNSYDADATSVDVTLDLLADEPSLVIFDHEGSGMDLGTIRGKWMEIGTNSKREKNRTRTPIHKRMPLGEKGVGRLAVHKLGKNLTVNTRADGHPEYRITINWPKLIEDSEYIEDTRVSIQELEFPEFFSDSTGTRIQISALNNTEWARGELRRLKRLLTSLVSPFDSVGDFKVDLRVPGREKDLKDILDSEDILDRAIWVYKFSLSEDGLFDFDYTFNPPSLFKELQRKSKSDSNSRLELLPPNKEERSARNSNAKDSLLLKPSDLSGIGKITGSFYVYYRDRKVLNAQGSYQDVKTYLDEQTGVRVYRDGIRVFNYGEPGDDWLDLNTARINTPGKKIATNMVIGDISLDLEDSWGLKEKTNREGFDHNDAYRRFKWICQSLVEKFHILHNDHREQLKKYIDGVNEANKQDPTSRFSENIASIRDVAKKHGLDKEIGGKIDRIEKDYITMRDVNLSSGIAGINLAVIFHEVERGIDDLNAAIKNDEPRENLILRSSHLSGLLEGFAPLLRRNEQKKFKISSFVKRVTGLSEHRFRHHEVILSNLFETSECPDFEVKAPLGLVQAAFNNLIDNSIHWTRKKKEESLEDFQPAIRVMSLTDWFNEGPALVVVDNGPGFEYTPEEAIQPFKSSRPAGMGLGLYYSDKVMETIGGRLIITSGQDLDLEEPYTGAAVVMIFKGLREE
jgi:hypothetical protein